MYQIGHYLNRISSIKVKAPNNLFDVEPDMSLLKYQMCPFCGKKLKIGYKKPIARCGRKNCLCPNKGGFIIRLGKLMTKNLK